MDRSVLDSKYIKFVILGIVLFIILLIFWGIYSLFHLVLHASICILVDININRFTIFLDPINPNLLINSNYLQVYYFPWVFLALEKRYGKLFWKVYFVFSIRIFLKVYCKRMLF